MDLIRGDIREKMQVGNFWNIASTKKNELISRQRICAAACFRLFTLSLSSNIAKLSYDNGTKAATVKTTAVQQHSNWNSTS